MMKAEQIPEVLKPTITGLNQLDVAVLMEKYVMILGMLHFGKAEEKTEAKRKLLEMQQVVCSHVTPAAFEEAVRRLELTSEEIRVIESTRL
ncbi:hypothetical protein [Brevibacillus centrosporus]|uniref:hypothetical protein n=1 Tax=Brevibacillus centrosporus TaxID=54910 RepID=UPI003B01CE93